MSTTSRSSYTPIMWWRYLNHKWTWFCIMSTSAGQPVPLSCPTGQTLVTSTEPNSASCQPPANPPTPLSCGEDTLIINGPDSASCQPAAGQPVPLSCPTGQTLVTSTEPNSASCQPATGQPVPLSCPTGQTLVTSTEPNSASCATSHPVHQYFYHVVIDWPLIIKWTWFCIMWTCHRSSQYPLSCPTGQTLSHFDWTQFCFMSTCQPVHRSPLHVPRWSTLSGNGSWFCIMSTCSRSTKDPYHVPTGQTLVTSTEPNSCIMSTWHPGSHQYLLSLWWRGNLNHKWTWFCIMSTCEHRSTSTPIMSYRSNFSYFDRPWQRRMSKHYYLV